ncbi:LytTr DNA-binding domain-containing protein [Pseudarcicella hirudinis]|uniref:LytTr DNA-binding domain-containing protein n=1 Tax=Pseudarcicella hirudinis TaxID=1079859 RepID=A0A1I5YEG9_9BACT|nr:LytTR family DNA-binding domain-containing protein [Pseudarcicella hirudinis]SFQ42573.1 LytTr DNA-binding domain-containing protein [Pseudarcicella hirudinis]
MNDLPIVSAFDRLFLYKWNTIYLNRKTRYISISDIILLKAESNYTSILMSDGKKIMLAKTLKEFEAILSNHPFVRIHRSYLINLNNLQSFELKDEMFVTMKTGKKIDISRRRKMIFREKFLAHSA